MELNVQYHHLDAYHDVKPRIDAAIKEVGFLLGFFVPYIYFRAKPLTQKVLILKCQYKVRHEAWLRIFQQGIREHESRIMCKFCEIKLQRD